MPNPLTNQIERKIAKDEPVKETRNSFNRRKKKDNDTDNTEYKELRNIRPKRYHDSDNNDDIEYKGLRDIKTLFESGED